MSEQLSRPSQSSLRDGADETQRRDTSLPSSSRVAEGSGDNVPQGETISTHLVQGRGHIQQRLPPISSLLNQIDDDRRFYRETATAPSGLRSISVSPASADYDGSQHHRFDFRRHQELPSESRFSISHLLVDSEPRQSYRLTPVHGADVSNIVRPASAHDSAYLSDLSTFSTTSSARGVPPPSHAGAESTTSASPVLSRSRVRNWQREQHPGEGWRPGMSEDLASRDVGQLAPDEYERHQERRAYFPVSTMRGGLVGSRGHPYSRGTSSPVPTLRVRPVEEEETVYGSRAWSDVDYEGEAGFSASSRQREGLQGSARRRYSAGSDPVSTATSPIPSERSTSAQSYGGEHYYSSASTSARPRSGYEHSHSWSEHRRALPEGAGDPRAVFATGTGMYASGSPSGGKDISRTSQPYRTHSPPLVSRGTTLNPSSEWSGRRVGSPSRASAGMRRSNDRMSPHSLPYTSLPRYSPGLPNVHSQYAAPDEVRYAKELPPIQNEGGYSATHAFSAPLPQRSYTFPATSDERAYSYQPYDAARTHYPGSPNLRPESDALKLVGSSQPSTLQQVLPRGEPIPSCARNPEPHSGSPRLSTSAPLPSRMPEVSVIEGEESNVLSPQYMPSQDPSRAVMHAPKPSHPLLLSSSSSPKAKRIRSTSLERLDTTPSVFVASRADTSIIVAPTGRSGRGAAGRSRGRGRGRGKRAAIPSPASDPALREDSQAAAPNQLPVFWGRQQREEHAASIRDQPSSSTSILAPGAQRNNDPPIHPELLGESGKTNQEVPGLSKTPRSMTNKGKATDEGRDSRTVQSFQVGTEADELQETTDDDEQHHFDTGASGLSGADSARGTTRTTRSKIEVACDFCRKRKMKCDGLRPSCKNCQRKGVACSYIPVVRRRGPGKKKKAPDTHPRKTSRRTEGDRRQGKGKGKGKDTEMSAATTQEMEIGELLAEPSGSGLPSESATLHVPPIIPDPTQDAPSSELYLPSPLENMQSPRGAERPPILSGTNISPFPSYELQLAPFPADHLQPYNRSPPMFGGGNLFLPPGHSPSMSGGEIVDPYAGVNVNIPESGRSTILSDETVHTTTRRASMMSSAPTSSEGEVERHAPRRRSSKRARTDQGNRGEGRDLEEGEIDETDPSSAARR